MRVTFLLLAVFLVDNAVAAAKPKRPHWLEPTLAGDCSEANTHYLENGDTVSVLYDALSVNMPAQANGDGLEARRVCTFRIDIQPPEGMYLASVRQLYSGGILKSKKSAAHLTVRYRVNQFREKPVDFDWKHGTAIGPESPDSLFSAAVDESVPFEKCKKRNRFAVNLIVAARRASVNEFVIGGFDSSDFQFVNKVTLTPVFKACR